MEREFGVRFSDDTYATKDEVKATLNIASVDSIWEKVREYRSFYTKTLTLRDIERKPLNVVLVPKITERIVALERKLTKLMIRVSRLESDENSYHAFEKKQYENILSIFTDNYSIDVSKGMLESVVEDSLSTIPPELLFCNRYLHTLKYYGRHFNDPFSQNVLFGIYGKLNDMNISNDASSYIRTTNLIRQVDHVYVGKHYEAAPLDHIMECLNGLYDFENNSPFFSLINATVVFFYINYVKPFEYYNEEISILAMKYVLAHSDFDELSFLLPLENLISKYREEKLKKVMLESEMKLDMTYLVNYVLDFIEGAVNDISDDIMMINVDSIKKENLMPSNIVEEHKVEPLKQVETVPNYEASNKIVDTTAISYEQKVSIPTLPIGLDEKDVQIIKEHLLEIYPSLKKNQAEFYARHCTIGKYYSIAQYKKEEEVAYETARTSMDNLADLGFYKKEKIRNKFVYTPIVRK